MTPQEQAIAAFEDTPVLVIAKLTGKAYGTVKAHRDMARHRGCGWITDKQQRVLDQLARGFTNKEVARALNIAEKTVKSHKVSIIARLGKDEFRRRIYRNA